jgi:peroxiredoxin
MNTLSFLALLFLGAVLLTTAPAEARTSLLPEGSRPPTFTLPHEAGRPVSLRTFLGSRRIVLLFSPSQRDLDTIQSQRTPFSDRDLTVLAVVPPGSPLTAEPGPIHVLTDPEGKVAKKYGASDGRPAFYLIGKDGHIAMAQHEFPAPHTLFGIIDAMPMRRQEMRERGQ